MTVLRHFILFILCCGLSAALLAADRREYQHGVEFVPLPDGRYWLLWSSSPGNPPEGDQKVVKEDGDKCKYFTHDVFYSLIEPNNPMIAENQLISMPEAQEPVSAAIGKNGIIATTFEDGSDSDIANCDGIIQQRYQLFDPNLKTVSKVKKVAVNGAHSGHIATVGNRFVIFYAEGWVSGGGVDEAGSANDIFVDVIDARGKLIHHRAIAVDKGSPRDWWPVIAGSDKYAILVWQRFVPDSNYANLMFAVYDPKKNKLAKEISLLKSNLVYYHYDVQYLPSIDRFLVVGNYLGDTLLEKVGAELSVISPKAFAYLLDGEGHIVDQWEGDYSCEVCMSYHTHSLVRESQPAILETKDAVKVLYPTKPKGLLAFNISTSKIELQNYIENDHYWFPLGTDGIFLDENTAYFANLTQQGLKTVTIKLQ